MGPPAPEPLVNSRDTQHDGTSHLAVKNTLIRRLLTLLVLRTTSRLYPPYGSCIQISRNIIVKRDRFVHLTEAATMNFVAANTSIPLPRVHCAFVHNNIAHIVMERIDGQSLANAWPSLSDQDKKSILTQLRPMVQELRAIKPPPQTGVQSCTDGSLTDSRIPHCQPRFGPFKTIQEFHVWLRQYFRPEDYPTRQDDQDWQDLKEMKRMQDGPWPPPVFTHGDLNPSNIYVRGNRVVGIIDWEFAGWYPRYWEYTSAWYGNRLWQDWQDKISDFLDPYPAELQMEITRQKAWGDF